MKALSLRQPWAWCVVHGDKRIENRSWRYLPRYRGPLFLHASTWWREGEAHRDLRALAAKGLLDDETAVLESARDERGGLVGLVTVVDADWNGERPTDPWARPGAVGIRLAAVEALELVPCRGRLGLFEPTFEDPGDAARVAEIWRRYLARASEVRDISK